MRLQAACAPASVQPRTAACEGRGLPPRSVAATLTCRGSARHALSKRDGFHGAVTAHCSYEQLRHPVSPRRRGQRARNRDPCRHQFLSLAERHDAVVAAGAVSDAEELLPAHVRTDRDADIHVSDHRIAAATPHRRARGQKSATLFARGRHELHAGRAAAARLRGPLRAAPGHRRAGRHRLRGLPSRVLARGAHGLGRQARAGAIGVPGRR
jgi:hypothetical protein